MAFAVACCCFLGCQSEAPRAVTRTDSTDLPPPQTTNKTNRIVGEDESQRTPPIGKYDGAMMKRIQDRWYDLLDEFKFNGERKGVVVVGFKLHPDGHVSDLVITKTTVDADLGKTALSAVEGAAPFEPWPQGMREKIKEGYREVTFRFNYN
jgi:TonB family protein